MIRKLMKYDLKKMYRILVYIYAISIVLAGITRLINIGKNIQAIAILGAIFAGITYSAIASVLINTFVQILRVFINSFYKDESYLTHTLPVSKSKLLLSKYLSSIIVILTSVVVSFVSLFIVIYTTEFAVGLRNIVNVVVSGFNMPGWLFLTILAFIIFFQICSNMSMAFLAIVKGNQYNSKRIPKGLGWFALFYFGSTYVTLMIAVIIFAISGNISQLFASVLSQGAFMTIIILGLVLYVIYSVLFYIICDKQFNKGVNVD